MDFDDLTRPFPNGISHAGKKIRGRMLVEPGRSILVGGQNESKIKVIQ